MENNGSETAINTDPANEDEIALNEQAPQIADIAASPSFDLSMKQLVFFIKRTRLPHLMCGVREVEFEYVVKR